MLYIDILTLNAAKSNQIQLTFFSIFRQGRPARANGQSHPASIFYLKIAALFTAKRHAFCFTAVTRAASSNANTVRRALAVFVVHAVARLTVHFNIFSRMAS